MDVKCLIEKPILCIYNKIIREAKPSFAMVHNWHHYPLFHHDPHLTSLRTLMSYLVVDVFGLVMVNNQFL